MKLTKRPPGGQCGSQDLVLANQTLTIPISALWFNIPLPLAGIVKKMCVKTTKRSLVVRNRDRRAEHWCWPLAVATKVLRPFQALGIIFPNGDQRASSV
jgi:hypothetical protein